MELKTFKLYPIPEVCKALDASRQTLYNEINTGRLKTVTRGTRRFVTPRQLSAYIELLESEAEAKRSGTV